MEASWGGLKAQNATARPFLERRGSGCQGLKEREGEAEGGGLAGGAMRRASRRRGSGEVKRGRRRG